jgi:hypothetical protein
MVPRKNCQNVTVIINYLNMILGSRLLSGGLVMLTIADKKLDSKEAYAKVFRMSARF